MAASPDPSGVTSYRADIDGLRAVAVLAVIAFHAFPAILPGGFTGVDVFFVISGYLISRIIFTGLRDQSFSFAEFYVRRINRIFPALATVLLATLAFGWLALLPDEYERLGEHAAAGAAFFANLVFMSEAGYFDVKAHAKPLLHLWSLGVEEQFYLLWPALCLVFFRKHIGVAALLAIAAIASFAFNVATVRTAPDIAFYSPASRFWELMVGGMVAHAQLAGRLPGARLADPLAWLGVAMIAGGLALISSEDPFPGWLALLPVLGTAAILAAGPAAVVNRHALALRPLAFVGLISYPLYLWHWPILSFLRIMAPGEPPPAVRAGAIAASFALAWFTWRFVERPIRFGPRRIPQAAAATAAVLAAGLVGTGVMLSAGLPSRASVADLEPSPPGLGVTMRQLRFRCPFRVGSFRNCFRLQSDGPAASVLIGDSHAAHLLPGLIRSPPPGGLDALIVNGGCPPLLGIERLFDGRPGPYGGLGATCSKLNAARLGYALKSPSRLVVLAFHGPQYSTNDSPDEGGASFKFAFDAKPMGDHDAFARALDRTVAAFIEAGKDVVLVGDTPSFDPDLFRRCALTRRPFTIFAVPQSACRMSRADAEAARSGVMSEFRRMAGQYPGRVRIFDAMDAVCSAEACPLRSEAGFLYRDHDHIAPVASEAIARALVATLR